MEAKIKQKTQDYFRVLQIKYAQNEAVRKEYPLIKIPELNSYKSIPNNNTTKKKPPRAYNNATPK